MTQITKEAIEAACVGYIGNAFADRSTQENIRKHMRAALEAALPFLPIAVEGKVKALEWHESLTDDGREQWHSNDRESITVMGNSFSDHERYWLFHAKKGFPSLQEAKAAAQSDFETRILSALISSPGKDGGQEGEAELQPASGSAGLYDFYAEYPDQPASTALVEWQQIDTAPRDGSAVLIWVDGHVIEACFDSEAYEWVAGVWGLGFDEDASYWRPLPSPPAQHAFSIHEEGLSRHD